MWIGCSLPATPTYYKLSNTISEAALQPHGVMIIPPKGHWTLRDFLVNIGSYADKTTADRKWNVYEVRSTVEEQVGRFT